MLDNSNIVIFSHPRSGTKLLASILENFGYHSHGEWYALHTTRIENNKAIRLNEFAFNIISRSEGQYQKSMEYMKRHDQYVHLDKSVITIWPDGLLEFPFMLPKFEKYHWVGVRRDCWNQVLSYYISIKNFNFDGIKESQPVLFKEDMFRKLYWDYHKVCNIQDWLIKNKNFTLLQFDDLINGKSEIFGRPYNVNSTDQHSTLESLVLNIDEVKVWYDKYERQRHHIMEAG